MVGMCRQAGSPQTPSGRPARKGKGMWGSWESPFFLMDLFIGVGFPPPRFDLGQGGEGEGPSAWIQVLEHEPFGGLGASSGKCWGRRSLVRASTVSLPSDHTQRSGRGAHRACAAPKKGLPGRPPAQSAPKKPIESSMILARIDIRSLCMATSFPAQGPWSALIIVDLFPKEKPFSQSCQPGKTSSHRREGAPPAGEKREDFARKPPRPRLATAGGIWYTEPEDLPKQTNGRRAPRKGKGYGNPIDMQRPGRHAAALRAKRDQ